MVFLTEPVGHFFFFLPTGRRSKVVHNHRSKPVAVNCNFFVAVAATVVVGVVSDDGFLEEGPMDRPRKCSLTHCTRLT